MNVGETTRTTEELGARRLARATGLLFVVLLVFGMLTALTLDAVLVPGDATVTASNVLGSRWLFVAGLVGWVPLVCADVAVAVTFHALLKAAGPLLSPLTAAFRLVYAATLVALVPQLFTAYRLLTDSGPASEAGRAGREAQALAGLESFDVGFQFALVFFGVHLVLLGVLLRRSGHVPAVLAGLVVAAGAGYLVHNLAGLLVDLPAPLSAVLLTPSLVGEVGMMIWLLVKGVRVPTTAPAPLK
ncbi:DUF4386 domain-containing protein [Actinoplanes sichuanensis]|uniref:DUF4386 domain-containing protein n=1 Tax=Actinoplanes sichuanensis TaxID=512349 RepID=A0ABW4AXF9_9ACTN|nr:DUF4386 domain-containing protein [Actinoplanes sichuanensis]BEL04670.1 DUF4386 domain-containing protein [Actinoplanes sichuanensis]